MSTRRLDSRSPRPAYANAVLSFISRLRNYNTLRLTADPGAVQIGTLYKSQLDDVKTWLDARYAGMRADMAAIRGGGVTRPISPIEPIYAPLFNDYGDFIPSPVKPTAVHNANYKGKPCQALLVHAGLSNLIDQRNKQPGKILPLVPGTPPLNQTRPIPPWPPWPAPIPPFAKPLNWFPELEDKYSKGYAHYWLFIQLYNDNPVGRTDLRALAYFTVNFWLYYYDIYRVAHNETSARQLCQSSLAALHDAIC